MAEGVEALLRFATKGRLGVLDLMGLPNVQVTTSGRKTGLARTATLQCVPAGDGLIVVGSNWGLPRHPSWSANLKATERVTVRRRGHRFTAKARLLRGGTRQCMGRGGRALAELSVRPRPCRRAPVSAVSAHADCMIGAEPARLSLIVASCFWPTSLTKSGGTRASGGAGKGVNEQRYW
jgi:deazaflavin-dependent oxidoreductase (nitroreductase family)